MTSKHPALLGAVLLLALALRLWGAGYGLPLNLLHSGERFFAMRAYVMHAQGTWNPGWFGNPPLFTYLIFLEAGALQRAGLWDAPRKDPDFVPFPKASLLRSGSPVAHIRDSVIGKPQYGRYVLLGRLTNAVLGTLAVWAVWRIGLLYFASPAVPLLGALLAAVSPHLVRHSKIANNTTALDLFLYLAFAFFSVHLLKGRSLRPLAWAGYFTGLAVATKYNAALWAVYAGALALAAPLLPGEGGRPAPRAAAKAFALFAGIAAAVFAAVLLHALLDPARLWEDLRKIRTTLADPPAPFVHSNPFLTNLFCMARGITTPVFLAAAAGIAAAFRKKDGRLAVLFAFPLFYYAGASVLSKLCFVDYIQPVLGFLCLAAAYAVVRLAGPDAGGAPSGRLRKTAAAVLGAYLVLHPLAFSAAYDRLLAAPDTRLAAVRYIRDRIPKDARLAMTHLVFEFTPLPILHDGYRITRVPPQGAPEAAERQGAEYLVVFGRPPLLKRLEAGARSGERFVPAAEFLSRARNSRVLSSAMSHYCVQFGHSLLDLLRMERFGPDVRIYRLRGPGRGAAPARAGEGGP